MCVVSKMTFPQFFSSSLHSADHVLPKAISVKMALQGEDYCSPRVHLWTGRHDHWDHTGSHSCCPELL